MKKSLSYLFLLLFHPFIVHAEPKLDSLLVVLDKTINERPIFNEQKEQRINDLKEELLKVSSSDELTYQTLWNLFNEYRSYKMDMSLYYAGEKMKIAERIGKQEYIDDTKINLAEVMMMVGMYKEALEQLQKVDKSKLADYLHLYYYHIYHTTYNLMMDYAVTIEAKREYTEKSNLYRDSLLMGMDPGSIGYILLETDLKIKKGDSTNLSELLAPLIEQFGKTDPNKHEQALLAYSIAEIYSRMGDEEKAKIYYAISAINDLRFSVKEYVSLRKLAMLLYQDDDVDRSYNYLKCSMEDALFCNARLRTIEISEVFPIINKAYQVKTQKQQHQILLSLACISILSVFLILIIIYVYKQVKRLAKARRELSIVNQDLKILNNELEISNSRLSKYNEALSDTNYIKEEYIGRYMNLCSVYIDKTDNYRRSLVKLAVGGKVEELFKVIKSVKFLDDELKEFYADFDNTFLKLFPTFIEDFNSLLVESERIIPKKEEHLTTELRVFALIRLGITDTDRIASFLRSSKATIYSYRSRIRNKSFNPETFEKQVMSISSY